MASETKYRVIGTRPVRPDGVDKVTGRAIYGADVVLPRMAHGKILRSPHAHARILRLDTSRAEQTARSPGRDDGAGFCRMSMRSWRLARAAT